MSWDRGATWRAAARGSDLQPSQEMDFAPRLRGLMAAARIALLVRSNRIFTGDGHEETGRARRRGNRSGAYGSAGAGEAQDRHHCHLVRAAGGAWPTAPQWI